MDCTHKADGESQYKLTRSQHHSKLFLVWPFSIYSCLLWRINGIQNEIKDECCLVDSTEKWHKLKLLSDRINDTANYLHRNSDVFEFSNIFHIRLNTPNMAVFTTKTNFEQFIKINNFFRQVSKFQFRIEFLYRIIYFYLDYLFVNWYANFIILII